MYGIVTANVLEGIDEYIMISRTKRYAEVEQIVRFELKDLLNNEYVQRMKEFTQHGDVTTFDHCFKVAVVSLFIAKLFGMSVNIKLLLVGAMLHDFYLYDWHKMEKDGDEKFFELHGFTHPLIAKQNAIEILGISEAEASVIETHMFPLTITRVPKCKEAALVCMADKICASKETLRGFVR